MPSYSSHFSWNRKEAGQVLQPWLRRHFDVLAAFLAPGRIGDFINLTCGLYLGSLTIYTLLNCTVAEASESCFSCFNNVEFEAETLIPHHHASQTPYPFPQQKQQTGKCEPVGLFLNMFPPISADVVAIPDMGSIPRTHSSVSTPGRRRSCALPNCWSNSLMIGTSLYFILARRTCELELQCCCPHPYKSFCICKAMRGCHCHK